MQDSNGISFYGEIVRKSIHLSNLIIPLSIYLFGPSKVFPYLLVTMFFCITMDLLRINNNYFRNIYNKIFGLITRNKESSIFTGATNVMIGSTIVTILFNEAYSVVDLPLPVGPVTRMMPLEEEIACIHFE